MTGGNEINWRFQTRQFLPATNYFIVQEFEKVRRLLVIKHGAFGDIIQAFGALKDIRRNFPSAEISVLTEPAFKKLMVRCDYVDQVLIDARLPRWRIDELFSLKRAFDEIDPDFVIDLQNSARSAFYRQFLLRKPDWSFINNARSSSSKYPKALPSLARLAGQLSDTGLMLKYTQKPDISWLANDVSEILQDAGVKHPIVTLIPGCSARHPHKRWPYYGALAEKFLDAGYDVVTVPGPDEIDLCNALPGITLTGDSFLNWFDLAGILQQSAFVVGNDTGPTHIAVHLERPGLALFGPHASAHSTGVLGRELNVLECKDLNDLSVEDVFARSQELISAHSKEV